MYNLAMGYQFGQGVDRDYAKAREWYERAAAKGSASALRQLAELHAGGLGLRLDTTRARELYEIGRAHV